MNRDQRRKRAREKTLVQRDRTRASRAVDFGYRTPDDLEEIGPLLESVCSVPASTAAAMVSAGRAPPAPIVGFMLIDTGASSTCIADDVALELGLPLVGIGQTFGAGGLHENRVYAARIEMAVRATSGALLMVAREDEMIGVPALGQHFGALNVTATVGGETTQARLLGLLGRDFLRHVRFTYDGPAGQIRVVAVDGSMPLAPGA